MSFQLKSIAIATLILFSAAVYAKPQYKDAGKNAGYVGFKDTAPCPETPQLMDGFYLGGQGGYDGYDINISSSIPGVGSNNLDLNARGFVGGFMLGFGRYVSDLFYLGGEIFGNFSNANESFTTTDADSVPNIIYNGKVTVNGSYGLAVLPGVVINDATTAYVRLGYNWVSIKYQESSTGSGSASKTNTSKGLSYGLGMETLLTGNWSLRTEYTYTDYDSSNTSLGSGTHVDPTDNQFMFSVLYHFA